MTRVIETTVYQFDELPEQAKEKAIERMRDINVDSYDWYDAELEYWKEELENLGFTDAKIYFSGFWNQGDGACFESTVDIPAFIKANHLTSEYRSLMTCIQHGRWTHATIKHEGHYYNKYTMRVEVEIDHHSDDSAELYDRLDDAENRLVNAILDVARTHADKIYDGLEKEYYYLVSDEAVTETIRVNEYEFTADGYCYP